MKSAVVVFPGINRERDMMLGAYCPLARGNVATDVKVQRIAERLGVSTGQVTLRWLWQQDSVVPLPKAASPEHRRANLDLFSFELSDEDVRVLDTLARGWRLIDPDFGPNWNS